ncbi:MAG: hypothetical protein DRI24_22790, partial [Deltaproteobacteria bacterium]
PLEKRGKRLDPITGTVVPDFDDGFSEQDFIVVNSETKTAIAIFPTERKAELRVKKLKLQGIAAEVVKV